MKGKWVHASQRKLRRGPIYQVGQYEVYLEGGIGHTRYVVADETEELPPAVPSLRTAVRVAEALADEDYMGVLFILRRDVAHVERQPWWRETKSWCERQSIEAAARTWGED